MKKILAFVLILTMVAVLSVNAFALVNTNVSYTDPYSPQIVDRQNVWYEEARTFVLREALMDRVIVDRYFNGSAYYVGCEYSIFEGEAPAPRSDVAILLSRYNGSYDTLLRHMYGKSKSEIFVDVPDGQNYTPAAQWAYENGIINGVGDDCFAPDRTITREEFAAMLYRYTEYLEVDTTARVDYSEFADSESVSDWAHDAMSWAVAEGLINGKPGGLLAPQDTITRAEVAMVIYRFNNEVKAHRDIWDGTLVFG